MKKRNSNSGRLKERGRENKWGGGEWGGGKERERERNGAIALGGKEEKWKFILFKEILMLKNIII